MNTHTVVAWMAAWTAWLLSVSTPLGLIILSSAVTTGRQDLDLFEDRRGNTQTLPQKNTKKNKGKQHLTIQKWENDSSLWPTLHKTAPTLHLSIKASYFSSFSNLWESSMNKGQLACLCLGCHPQASPLHSRLFSTNEGPTLGFFFPTPPLFTFYSVWGMWWWRRSQTIKLFVSLIHSLTVWERPVCALFPQRDQSHDKRR